MPRPSCRRYSRKPPASVMRSTASRSCGPQSQRWLPNTSPVRHSLCGRTSGGGPPAPDAPAAARSPEPRARCSRPSTSPSKREHARGRGVPVGEPQRHRHLGADRRVRWQRRRHRSPRSVRRGTAGTARSAAARRRRSGAPRRASRAGRGSRGSGRRSTNRRARESPTKNGATTRCSSSARSAVRNWVCTVPPPSTISRRTPRACEVLAQPCACRPAGRRRRRSPPARAARAASATAALAQ